MRRIFCEIFWFPMGFIVGFRHSWRIARKSACNARDCWFCNPESAPESVKKYCN